MTEQDFQILRNVRGQLVPVATVLCLGHSPRQAMDRAALAINIDARLAPDVLLLQDAPGQVRIVPSDILVGGGVTCRVLGLNESVQAAYAGLAVNLT